MAVLLQRVYELVKPDYEIELVTESCFDRIVNWVHILEEPEFISLLQGEELILSSGLKYSDDKWIENFVKRLIEAGASGLVFSVHTGVHIPRYVIDYCNEKHFPVFEAGWRAPYIELTRLFAEQIIRNEQRESNLITALKNALYYPENEEVYVNPFEHNGMDRNMSYVIIIISCNQYLENGKNPKLEELERRLQYNDYKGIVAREKDRLIVLAADQSIDLVEQRFDKISKEDHHVYIGVGTEVKSLKNIRDSYEHARTAYHLTKSAIATNFLVYDRLGVYKVLSDMKNPKIGDAFVEEVLGKLIEYDEDHKADYIEILRAFFENECSILRTSEALYCHKNTLNYKMNRIKEILGYDIMSNENRTRIMIALYFIKMRV